MACEFFFLLRKDSQTGVDYNERIMEYNTHPVKSGLSKPFFGSSVMSALTLGLDLGPSSIGWALLDEANEWIVSAGVRVFPEGVDRDNQGGEKSKTQTRRDARGARRQIAGRAARKKHLRHLLTAKGLLPKDEQDLQGVLAADPYDLRRRALDEPLMPHEAGRG